MLEPLGNLDQTSLCCPQNQIKKEVLIHLHRLKQFARSDPLWNVNFHHPLRHYILYSYTQAMTHYIFQIYFFL